MPDAVGFVKIIKQAAKEAVEAGKPVNILFGTVISATPLQIKVEQKMMLGPAQLLLSRHVTDYETELSVEWQTEEAQTEEGQAEKVQTKKAQTEEEPTKETQTEEKQMGTLHRHAVTGRKKIIIHNGLAANDEVLLLRQQDGQKYVVWDRIGT